MRDSDIPQITVLNNDAHPAVPVLSEQQMLQLKEFCDVALTATNNQGQIIAFILSMGGGKEYTSENYQWFESLKLRHQYIDRVVVDASAKGTGIGRALYESVFERARERGANEVTAEVNLEPPNPGSVLFHERLGFRKLGEQDTKDGTIKVALLARSVYQ
jgi:predicted GNAT superfamily acetyltransferase